VDDGVITGVHDIVARFYLTWMPSSNGCDFKTPLGCSVRKPPWLGAGHGFVNGLQQ
jgi:hypothetical protein